MTDNGEHPTLFDSPPVDPLPPAPATASATLGFDAHIEVDLAQLVAANRDEIKSMVADGEDVHEAIEQVVAAAIERALWKAAAPGLTFTDMYVEIAYTDVRTGAWDRAAEAMEARYPKMFVGDL